MQSADRQKCIPQLTVPYLLKVGLHTSVGLAVATGVSTLAPVEVESGCARVGKSEQRISNPEGTCIGVTQANTTTTIPACSNTMTCCKTGCFSDGARYSVGLSSAMTARAAAGRLNMRQFPVGTHRLFVSLIRIGKFLSAAAFAYTLNFSSAESCSHWLSSSGAVTVSLLM